MSKSNEYADKLGRIAIPDVRDWDWPMADAIADADAASKPTEEAGRTFRYWWQSGWKGDQGRTPRCTAFAALHALESGPTTHFYESRDADPEYMAPDGEPIVDPTTLYERAQRLDRWPGKDYDGSSVRAAAKALREAGLVEAFHWARSVDEIVETVKTTGPVVAGTPWLRSMFEPDDEGIVRADPDTSAAGGHAYVINGVNDRGDIFRLLNSWGSGWSPLGDGWHAHIPIKDFETVFQMRGEACLMVETENPGAEL